LPRPSPRFCFASRVTASVARRYKTPVGEIDLVALKAKRLAFVEVKRRSIVRAAQYWLAGHPDFAATTSPSKWCQRHLGLGRAI
jgi:Holliday junction resolvase-like predicted endonuclease